MSFQLYIEIIASSFALLGVWLTIKHSIWSWPVGLIGVFIYTGVYWSAKLYADFGLHIFYILQALYGWYEWHNIHKKLPQASDKKHPNFNWTTIEIISCILFCIAFTSIQYTLLSKTDASFPLYDSTLTSFSLAATFLMARKKIQHWILWFFIDGAYIGLYISKELYITAGLYFIFTILVIKGYFEWKPYTLSVNKND
jgi:nicotinamide mononucleotide transporter